MKKIRILCLFLGVLLVFTAAIPAVQAEAMDQSAVNGCHGVDAQMPLSDEKQLVETAKAVIVYDLVSDTMIYTWNPDQQIYPSSMVKLMTALVALEHGELTDKVVVTKRALSHVAIGSVSAGLIAGEELTLGDLLYCMMAASANDAATVIAEHIGGNQDTFIKLMNEKATALGCTGTHYSNVHGLHDEQTYTTARDLCRILEIALEDPEFKMLFSAESYTVPKTNKSEPRQVYTSNYMMSNVSIKKYYDQRVTGGKTGATDEAGRCLAATAQGKGMELLTIVMGAKATYEADGLSLKTFGSFEETKVLLDYTLENFEHRQLYIEGQTVSQFPVEGGTNSVVVTPEKPASTVLPIHLDTTKLTWIYPDAAGTLTAPVKKGQKISSVQVWYGSKCLAQINLVAAHEVPVWKAPAVYVPQAKEENMLEWKTVGTVLVILFAGAMVVVAMIFIRRGILSAMLRSRRRRRRINRRRSR